MGSIIVRDASGTHRVLHSKAFKYEELLQRTVAELPSIIPLEAVTDKSVSHLTLGVEWPAGAGSADLVLVGSDSVLTVIETKLSRNPQARREVVGQILEYAAYLSEWTIYEIQLRSETFFRSKKCPAEYRGKSFDDVLTAFLSDAEVDSDVHSFKGEIEKNLRRGRVRLIVAVDEVGQQAQKIVSFVNSHSSFELYLLQVSAFEDTDGRNIFVPVLFGYANKMSASADYGPADWDERARALVARLELLAEQWDAETRYYKEWVDVACLGSDEVFGIQNFKRTGLNLYFWLDKNPGITLPDGVSGRQTKDYLYLSGNLESLSDEDLRRLCEAALRHDGREPS